MQLFRREGREAKREKTLESEKTFVVQCVNLTSHVEINCIDFSQLMMFIIKQRYVRKFIYRLLCILILCILTELLRQKFKKRNKIQRSLVSVFSIHRICKSSHVYYHCIHLFPSDYNSRLSPNHLFTLYIKIYFLPTFHSAQMNQNIHLIYNKDKVL